MCFSGYPSAPKQCKRNCLTLPLPDTMQCQEEGTDLGGGAGDSEQQVRPVHGFCFQDFQKKLLFLILSFSPGAAWAVIFKEENRKYRQGNPIWFSLVLPHEQHPAHVLLNSSITAFPLPCMMGEVDDCFQVAERWQL